MSEHTQGPWYREEDNAVFTVGDLKMIVDSVESTADARLIAAAPDLLEVARIALEVVGLYTADGAPGAYQVRPFFSGSSAPDFEGIRSFIEQVLADVEG